MPDRRIFLAGAAAAIAGPALAQPAALRGSIDATELGVDPAGSGDQSKAFNAMLRKAADRDMPVFLPPGNYIVSNIGLPARTRLFGVAGASRLIHGGGGAFLSARGADRIELADLVIDGANQFLSDRVRASLDIRAASAVSIAGCRFTAGSKGALSLEGVGGRIERNEIADAGDVGIYSLEARGLSIVANRVAECGNGGILVHRSETGNDGTIVSGNRVERIRAVNGGTGQFGNGINIFRAENVAVSDNWIDSCAFSAIRSNNGNNIRIAGNTCLHSGETAIYSEFAFEGALITGNIVHGAANGISVVNFDKGGRLAVVSGNLVRDLSQRGPYPGDAPGFGSGIVVEADTTVTGNTIEGAPLHGMRLGWGPYLRNVVASGNVIRDAGVGIAVSVVEGTGAVTITGNVISETPKGAIVGYRWSDPVTADLVANPGHGFPGLAVANNQAG
jgi:uncharacterized secreted repeat protein (TIGR03808 family)